MTDLLFREDAWAMDAGAHITAHTPEGGVVTDRTVFYPTGGGQPGDSGVILWSGGRCEIATAVKGEAGSVVHVPASGQVLPPVGEAVQLQLDHARRTGHMRVHTALHLMSVAVPFGVTGGSISADKGRLDFDMEDPLDDKDAVEAQINDLIATDAPVSEEWISDEDLDARPDLVKTLSVQPPRGAGRVRLIRIADGDRLIDLQPCGGTHVSRLSEIGRIRLGKTEKKGRRNRRVYLHIEPQT